MGHISLHAQTSKMLTFSEGFKKVATSRIHAKPAKIAPFCHSDALNCAGPSL